MKIKAQAIAEKSQPENFLNFSLLRVSRSPPQKSASRNANTSRSLATSDS
jgi:hypothetical protein